MSEVITVYGNQVIEQIKIYWGKFFTFSKLILAFIVTHIMEFMFPDRSLRVSFVVVLVAMVLDVIVKYVVTSIQCGGYRQAIECKALQSSIFWDRTVIKLITNLTLLILSGLAFKITADTLIPSNIAIKVIQIVYLAIFFRESQSVLETLSEVSNDTVTTLEIIKEINKAIGEKVLNVIKKFIDLIDKD